MSLVYVLNLVIYFVISISYRSGATANNLIIRLINSILAFYESDLNAVGSYRNKYFLLFSFNFCY